MQVPIRFWTPLFRIYLSRGTGTGDPGRKACFHWVKIW